MESSGLRVWGLDIGVEEIGEDHPGELLDLGFRGFGV